MVKRVQIVRHSTTALADTFTGLVGELSVDQEKDELRIHDAILAGGHILLKEDASNIRDLPTFRATIELNTNWDLKSVSDLSSNGIPVRTGAATAVVRTIAGTANEVILTNGDGVAANPTVSLPSSLIFTGKTITDGTFNGIDIGTGATLSGGLSGSGTANFSGMSLTFANDQISGNVIDGGDISGILTLSGSSITVTNNLVVNGMLTASSISGPIAGTSDAFFIINSDVTGTPTEDSGITVERGTSINARIFWNETLDEWQVDTAGSVVSLFSAAGPPFPNSKRWAYWASSSSTTAQGTGDVLTPTGTVSAIAANSSDPMYRSFATAAVLNADAGVEGDSFYRMGRNLKMQLMVDVNSTDERVSIGFTNQTLAIMVGSDNPAGDYAHFKHSTGVPDTTWQCITKDGTTQNITDSLVTVGTSFTKFEIEADDTAGSIIFRIDGVVVATHTVNLPRTFNTYNVVCGIETLSAGGKNIRLAWCYTESDL